MKKSFSRLDRIAGLIRTTLADIMQREAEDTRFNMVTITHVNVSPDLANAKVFVSILNDTEVKKTITALNHAAKYFRYALAHKIELRVTPQLRFVYDDSTARGSHISSLIDQALKKNSL